MNEPSKILGTGLGSAVAGALITFLLTAQTEDIKHDNEMLGVLGNLQSQTGQILAMQHDMQLTMQDFQTRLNDIERDTNRIAGRQDRLEREQTDLDNGTIKLRHELQTWIARQNIAPPRSPDDIAYPHLVDTIREIIALEGENRKSVWTKRGAPYADTKILSRRLARPVNASERDLAAALITASRIQRPPSEYPTP